MSDVLVADAEAQTTNDESAPLSTTTRNLTRNGSIQAIAPDEVSTEEVRHDESRDRRRVGAVHRRRRNGSETVYATPTGRMPRQWLFDRCDGTSKINPESRPPCVACYVPFVIKLCPDILEQNCMCESVGRRGCIDPENAVIRRRLFFSAFVINVIGLLLMVVTSFSIATHHFDLLWRAGFTDVWLFTDNGTVATTNRVVSWVVGLRAVAYVNRLENVTELFTFTEQCEFQDDYQATMTLLVDAKTKKFACSNCKKISHKIVPSLFLSMLSYIPNFTTDILRMYSNYDVNCQKFLASTFSWISLATSIYTWVNYRKGCFDSLNMDPFALNKDFQMVDMNSEDVYVVVQFGWKAGLGQICLLLATLLKVVDIAINILLPTPTITRNHQEQVDYEWKYGQVVEIENDAKPDNDDGDCPRPRITTSECTDSPREQTHIYE